MPFGLLIRRKSNSHTLIEIERGCWKDGDLVCVYPIDRCQTEPHPGSPHAIFVIVDGPSHTEIERYLGPRTRPHATKRDDEGNPLPEIIQRSRWYFAYDSLSTTLQEQIITRGRVEIKMADFEAFCFNRDPVIPFSLKALGGHGKAHG